MADDISRSLKSHFPYLIDSMLQFSLSTKNRLYKQDKHLNSTATIVLTEEQHQEKFRLLNMTQLIKYASNFFLSIDYSASFSFLC